MFAYLSLCVYLSMCIDQWRRQFEMAQSNEAVVNSTSGEIGISLTCGPFKYKDVVPHPIMWKVNTSRTESLKSWN